MKETYTVTYDYKCGHSVVTRHDGPMSRSARYGVYKNCDDCKRFDRVAVEWNDLGFPVRFESPSDGV